jgi:hypothetical protein
MNPTIILLAILTLLVGFGAAAEKHGRIKKAAQPCRG